jgi:DNA-binding LytR/AlgR family response regulator
VLRGIGSLPRIGYIKVMNTLGLETVRDARGKPKPVLYFGLAFWIFSYLLLSIRAGLVPEQPFDLWSAKRLLATATGAITYLIVLARIVDAPKMPAARQLQAIVALMLPAAAIVLAVRVMFDHLSPGRDVVIVDDIRWILVWTGYFAAWIAAYIIHGNYQQLQLLELQQPVAGTADAPATGPRLNFWARRGTQSVRLHIEAIESFEAEGNYVRIHARDGATGFMRLTLRQLQDELDPHVFIRVHRSTICRKTSIQALKRHAGGGVSLMLESGTEVAVGRSFAKAVLAECAAG